MGNYKMCDILEATGQFSFGSFGGFRIFTDLVHVSRKRLIL